MKTVLLVFISIYQRLISPILGSSCRFYPSCSNYVKEALITEGVVKGLGLGAVRLCKCQPFHSGGVDMLNNKYELRS